MFLRPVLTEILPNSVSFCTISSAIWTLKLLVLATESPPLYPYPFSVVPALRHGGDDLVVMEIGWYDRAEFVATFRFGQSVQLSLAFFRHNESQYRWASLRNSIR